LTRSRMLEFFGKLLKCLVGIEACASSHYWARELIALGHEVKLTPAQYVKPLRCAPKARVTSGGRFRAESCRLIW
jgi:hypothetical protein